MVLASFVAGAIVFRFYQSLTSSAVSVPAKGVTQEDLTTLVKRVEPAVLTIVAYDSKGKAFAQGSGFFVSQKGELLTNHHVLKTASSAEAETTDGKTYSIATVIADDPDSDLVKAVVLVDDPVPFLPIAKQRP